MEEILNFTKAEYDELVKELQDINEKIELNKKDISTARSYGDLSENSEYEEAKQEQAKLAHQKLELENRLSKAKIIDESELDASVISVGSLVKVFHHEKNANLTYQIVGSYGTDPAAGKISDVSPIGAALMGKRAGEKVEVELPRDKKYHIDILDVTRAKGDHQ